jgi:hypothetical protein
MICSSVNRLGFMSIPHRRWTLPIFGGGLGAQVIGAHCYETPEARTKLDIEVQATHQYSVCYFVAEHP